MNSCEYIVLHHSASTQRIDQFSSINAYHKRQGFPLSHRGFYVGYHYVIEKNGHVCIAREDDETGSHTVSMWPPYWDMNRRGIGICLAGDFTKEAVSLEQLQSLRELVDELRAKHGIPLEKVILHRQAKSTSCPGVDLVYLMESMTGTKPSQPLPFKVQLAQVVKAIARYLSRQRTPTEDARLRQLERKEDRLEVLIEEEK